MVYFDEETNIFSPVRYPSMHFVHRTYKTNHEYQIYSCFLSCSSNIVSLRQSPESLLPASLITKLLHSVCNVIQSLQNSLAHLPAKWVTHTLCDLHRESPVQQTPHAEHVISSRTSKTWAHVYLACSSSLVESGDKRRSRDCRVWISGVPGGVWGVQTPPPLKFRRYRWSPRSHENEKWK